MLIIEVKTNKFYAVKSGIIINNLGEALNKENIDPNYSYCTKCFKFKKLDEFIPQTNRKSLRKVTSSCRACYDEFWKGPEGKLKKKENYWKDPEKEKRLCKEYRIKNKEKVNAKQREKSRRESAELHPTYVKSRIQTDAKKIYGSKLKEVPKELIELKKIQLKTRRMYLERKNGK